MCLGYLLSGNYMKIFLYIISWLVLAYLQVVLWDVFNEWTLSFTWDELTGSVFYVAFIKLFEVCIGIFLLLSATAMMVAPIVLIAKALDSYAIK